MFIEKVKTEGLAHLSWIVGDDKQAAVIDPRRDIDVYLELAQKYNVKITHILETHRNEDLITGSPILARLTGAKVLHGPEQDDEISYAEVIRDGTCINFSGIEIKALHTPGHTNDSMSYVVYDKKQGGPAIVVFTGDTLFIGDVGRTDFYPEKMREAAGNLYDSLQKILELGDQAVVCPAHGAGSVCGSGMADRELSTLGHERAANSMLRYESKDEFIGAKVNEQHYKPPYFSLMEKINSQGVQSVADPLTLKPLEVNEVKALQAQDYLVVDVRGPESYASSHVLDSLCLPLMLITAYGGWLIQPWQNIVLIAESISQAKLAQLHFMRIGYDRIVGAYLQNMAVWAATGESFGHIHMVSVGTVRERVEMGMENWSLLDVRKAEELAASRIESARHIYLGQLADQVGELDRSRHYTVLCGSGVRAAVGASVLDRAGFKNVDIFLGSMGAWNES